MRKFTTASNSKLVGNELAGALDKLKEGYSDFKKEKSPARKKELGSQMRASARPRLQTRLGDDLNRTSGIGGGSTATTPLGASGMSPGSARANGTQKFFGGLVKNADSGQKKSATRIGLGMKPRGTVMLDPK